VKKDEKEIKVKVSFKKENFKRMMMMMMKS
jgi:hypothetical protein